MFMVLSSWQSQCESSPGLFDKINVERRQAATDPGAAPRFWKWGDNFARSARKNFFDPPLFGQWGGGKILLLFRCLQVASRKIVDGVMRHTPG